MQFGLEGGSRNRSRFPLIANQTIRYTIDPPARFNFDLISIHTFRRDPDFFPNPWPPVALLSTKYITNVRRLIVHRPSFRLTLVPKVNRPRETSNTCVSNGFSRRFCLHHFSFPKSYTRRGRWTRERFKRVRGWKLPLHSV